MPKYSRNKTVSGRRVSLSQRMCRMRQTRDKIFCDNSFVNQERIDKDSGKESLECGSDLIEIPGMSRQFYACEGKRNVNNDTLTSLFFMKTFSQSSVDVCTQKFQSE